ncbi:hypothetical protein V1520DRAFT_108511 [Lipomyces starkeyi]|uniref:Uncharacterized protein n=1 Tax=Lipomyces starkeyi NRRL Y-11557 TaxID=675824 RepID=A0A1E3Q0S8_LIPST|nr:hypothetical protein LIPSTDRAFT_119306 [Lipomyces starkeyi NRRL Y-11557]
MASCGSEIPPESSREAELQREMFRAEQRARAHSPDTSASSAGAGNAATGEHSSPRSGASADGGSASGSSGNNHDEDRYELSFVIRPPSTVTVSTDVSPPVVVRIRRFRGDHEILAPALISSSPVSERSHSSFRSLEEATYISSSEHSSGLEEGIILLFQLALYDADEYTAIEPSSLQGVTVVSPEVYLDPQRQLEADDNNGDVAVRAHRYFGVFSNFRITESGHYWLFVVLLQGVGLAPLMHGQVAPAGPQLARITVPITAAETSEQTSEAENGVIGDEERRILQDLQEQGADVPIY